METILEPVELEKQYKTDKNKSYSVEEIFDRIDNKFINFYGEYGRKIVNTRRTEWNQDGIVNMVKL